ncbi:MAG: FAD binding domain-containing protein [Nocardioidaceae bacterium]
MKPAPFAYLRPESTGEALAALAEHAGDVKVLAGGQSLVPLLSMRLASPAVLVDINRVTELAFVRCGDGGVRVGALARQAALERDPDAFAAQPLLRRTLALVAHPTIRNRGTTVGSIAHADPAAELPAVLRLLDGTVTCSGPRGRRVVPADQFFVGPLESSLGPAELVTEVMFPSAPARTGSAVTEVSRRHGDYALCGVAATVTVDAAGVVVHARAAYFSVADTPTVLDLTGALEESVADEATVARASDLARSQLHPDADIHASADYRAHLAGVLTARVLNQAYAEAGQRQDGRGTEESTT